MASEHVVHVTDDTFEAEVINADTPVLLDFWAEWCGPCKAIAPLLDQLADEYGGKVKVAKLDIDHSPNVPAKFGIRGIPTLIVFKDGKEVNRQVGAGPKDLYAKMIDDAL
jgi:thioredoxin 1